jgi:hypothetical protein
VSSSARRVVGSVRGIASATWARLALFGVLAVGSKWFWLSTAGSMVDYRDAHYNSLFEDAARISVAKYHELPLWNPFYCGGVYALGTPSARFTSPTLLLSVVFGVLRASPLIAVLACFAGLEGTYRYARAHRAGTLGAMLAAPLFALSGFFPRSGSFEWVNFLGFELLPWAALGLHRALSPDERATKTSRVRGAVLAGGAVGWMTLFGGTYAAPYTLLVALWELFPGLVRALRRKTHPGLLRGLLRGLLYAMIAGLLGAGIAAARLWPIAETLAAAPRVLGAIDANSPLSVAKMLFGAKIPFRGDFLVGALVLPFAVMGAIERKNVWLLGAACFFLWLSSGYAAQPSGYALLRLIPPYTMLRSPERFLVPFALFYAVLAARGFGRVEAFVRKRRWRPTRKSLFVLAGIILACVDDGVLFDNDWAWQRGRSLMEATSSTPASRDFKNARGDRWLAAYYPEINRGTLSCFDDYQVPQSALLRGDLKQEEFLLDASAGKVERHAWSPNRISLHAELTKPARVVVNQNWHPGWRAEGAGATLVSEGERLAVDLPAGPSDVVLAFRPRSGIYGLLASLLAIAAAVLLWLRTGLKPASQLAVAAAPLAVVGLAFAFVHEPPRPERRLLLPDGDPIVQTDPPRGADPVGATFEEGISLEAKHIGIRQTIDGPVLDFELDWKLAHPAPPGLGIFVHFEPDKGDTVNVDHVGIATVAPFEAFPSGMILRDVLPGIGVEAGKTYKIYLGVWRARRGGERLRVLSPGTVPVDDNRLLVATIHS